MPSRDELAAYRAALYGGRSYQAPRISDYGDYGGGSLGDLIGRRGQAQARHHLAGADTLAQGFRDALGGVAGYFQEREQKKEMAKRDAASVAAIEGWDGANPLDLYKSVLKVRGPEDALQFTNAALSLRGGPKKDPKAELADLGEMAVFLESQSDDAIARAMPALKRRYGGTLEMLGQSIEGDWNPETGRPFLGKIGELWGPKKERRKLTEHDPSKALIDEDGKIVIPAEAKPAEKKLVPNAIGPDGRPMAKLASEEELERGVPTYREPKAPATDPAERQMQWAIDPETGEERLMTNAEIRRAGGARPATADMRNKAQGRVFVKRSIDAIRGLSEKVITKRGLAQRATAAGRTVESALGNDPEFRTYQDARKALAGNLAVAQQGSRPSDADIQSIWLPMVPDVFRDTDESAKMKWDLIDTMSLPETKGGAGGQGGGPVRVNSKAELDKLPSGTIYIGPSGKTRRKP